MPTIDRSQRVRLPNVPNAVPTGSRARAGLRTYTRRPGPTGAERQARTRAERGSVGKRGTYVRSKLKAVRRARDAMRSRGRSISAAPFGTRTRRARHARGRGGRTPRVLNSMYERNVCARCRLTTHVLPLLSFGPRVLCPVRDQEPRGTPIPLGLCQMDINARLGSRMPSRQVHAFVTTSDTRLHGSLSFTDRSRANIDLS